MIIAEVNFRKVPDSAQSAVKLLQKKRLQVRQDFLLRVDCWGMSRQKALWKEQSLLGLPALQHLCGLLRLSVLQRPSGLLRLSVLRLPQNPLFPSLLPPDPQVRAGGCPSAES